MTYTKIQLDIIREFGSKELTRGCFLKVNGRIDICNDGNVYEHEGTLYARNSEKSDEDNIIEEFEILGHIPHLEDVFRVAIEQGYFISIALQSRGEYILSIYGNDTQKFYSYNPSLPLLDQDESTLTQLLTLLGK